MKNMTLGMRLLVWFMGISLVVVLSLLFPKVTHAVYTTAWGQWRESDATRERRIARETWQAEQKLARETRQKAYSDEGRAYATDERLSKLNQDILNAVNAGQDRLSVTESEDGLDDTGVRERRSYFWLGYLEVAAYKLDVKTRLGSEYNPECSTKTCELEFQF